MTHTEWYLSMTLLPLLCFPCWQLRRRLKSYQFQSHSLPKLDGSATLVRVLFLRNVCFMPNLQRSKREAATSSAATWSATSVAVGTLVCKRSVSILWGKHCVWSTRKDLRRRRDTLNNMSWSGNRLRSHRNRQDIASSCWSLIYAAMLQISSNQCHLEGMASMELAQTRRAVLSWECIIHVSYVARTLG